MFCRLAACLQINSSMAIMYVLGSIYISLDISTDLALEEHILLSTSINILLVNHLKFNMKKPALHDKVLKHLL